MKRVVVTGASGQIAYSLIFRIASGELFGKDVPIALHLMDINADPMKGVAMELDDCAFPLLKEVKFGTDPNEMFQGINYAFLVGAAPRKAGMERKDLLMTNAKIFVDQGKALNKAAAKDVRVLVVGNPCNTNCLIAMHHAPNIAPQQFFAMTRLDQNRAASMLARKAGVGVEEVKHMTIWGNHSSTQVPDIENVKLPLALDRKWLETEFIAAVQQRGAEVIKARGASSAASAANAALGAMKSVLAPNDWFSMGVASKGNPYGIDPNLVFSFPCRSTGKGDAQIIPNVPITPFLQEKIRLTQKELMEERDAVADLLR